MNYNIIDILLESELYDDYLLASNYSEITNENFYDLLLNYNKRAEHHLLESTTSHLNNSSPLNIYIPERKFSSYFSKALLSMDSVVIDDEIIDALTYIQDYEVSNYIIKLHHEPVERAKEMVSGFVRYIKKNQALVSNGSIQIIPNPSKDYESKKKRTVLYNDADERHLWDLMPKNTINIYKKSINITPLKRVNQDGDNIYYKELKNKSIAGELNLTIENCSSNYINGYIFSLAHTFYDEHGILRVDNSSRVMSIPTTRASYDNWVAGVINRTIREHFVNLSLSLSMANEINSSLGYDCNFTNRILNNINKEGNTSRKMLEVNTPFLTGLSTDTIAKIKNDYGDSFNSYKKVLRDTAYKLQLTNDKQNMEIINKEFKERLYDEGIKDVELALTSLRKKSLRELVIESGIAGLGFIDTKLTMMGLVGTSIAVARTAKSIKESHTAIKGHPSYFLLKTRQK